MVIKGLIGKKLGMTQQFKDDKLIPVTLVNVDSCIVTDIKTADRDGYTAVQLGFEDIAEKKLNKPRAGKFAKMKVKPKRYSAELRTNSVENYSIGQDIKAEIFAEGEKVSVTSISKGKGFAGVMKRWNFAGMGASHGVHRVHRGAGSIGCSATPSRVFPGKKMAGHLGNEKVTVKNLAVVGTDQEKGLLILRGAVPGPKGALVFIKGSEK